MNPPRRVAAFGECMLELQGQAFGTLQQTFGGDTLNTAVYLSRCAGPRAVSVAYATALGDDGLSDGLVARWQAEGLDTTLVRRLPGRLPGLYLIDVDPSGERRFSYWRDQSAARAYFDSDAATPLETAADTLDGLYFSGISLAILPPAGRARLLALAQRMRDRGAVVAYDNNHRPRLWPDAATARTAHGQALAIASLGLVTLDDEALLHGCPVDDALLARTLALPCPELVIKRGADATLVRGASSHDAAAVVAVPTEPVSQVVDTTAAGDSFAGAYLAARLSGHSPQMSAQAGNRLAARVVQHRGALVPRGVMADLMAG